MNPFAAAIAAAASGTPMSVGSPIPGRLLGADGDGLAYYCAGNEDTAPGQARLNLLDKLRSARAAAGAESVKILLTGRGSHKGYRYAVARVQPYQGKRDNSTTRVNNWAYLRELMETGGLGPEFDIEITADVEADDLFARYSASHPDFVIYTQDKDMRMVEGMHLDWVTHTLVVVRPGQWSEFHDGKQYGRAWFFSQMLHGDDADNIPGLPFYKDGSLLKSGPKKGEIKEIRCGERSDAVLNLLPKVSSDMGGVLLLQNLYRSCYGDRWLVEMLEQGILLWMRSDPQGSALNVVAPGNPLQPLTTHELWPAAKAEIMARIAEAVVHATTQDHGSGTHEDALAGLSGEPVQPVQAAVLGDGGGPGSRPLDGVPPWDVAPGVQCPAGQDREQPQAVRREEPRGVPAWGRRLLAKARDAAGA